MAATGALAPAAVSVKLELVTEAPSSGPAKVALTEVPAATPAAEAGGLFAITSGAPAVVKLHEVALPRGDPSEPFTVVSIDAVGVPVLNPLQVTLRMAELLVASGLSHSKRSYPVPPKLAAAV